MSRFNQELRVVPRNAWIVGVLLYLCAAIPVFVFAIPSDLQMRRWPLWDQALFAFGIFLPIVVLVALIGYIYGDAKRRGMRYVMWTLLAIFIPDAIGIIIYFLLRDPLPKTCPGCGRPVKSGFAFCPHCGTTVQPACPNCGHAVELDWANCPKCGQKLPSQSTRAA
ncbi:MAG TPA: zinc ribbon domain-containing protein [Candidatus Limnocylindrales bacterium]|nr:zinc ribbon domain-containing protein [Candidatus Limnocylindrales bacterium]